MFVLGGVGIVLLDLALDKNRAKSVKVSYASAGVASVVISYVMSMLFVRIKIPGFGQKKMVWVRWGTICLPKYHGGSYKEHYVRTWGRLLCRSSSASFDRQKNGCRSLKHMDDHRRLCLYAALFLPFRKTIYRDNKGKKIPVVSYIFCNSLKLKASDAETVVSLHLAAEKFVSLIPLILSNEDA